MTQAFPAGSTVGLIAMSAKPFHAGHFGLIEQAARKNDHVLVYVSISDRKRKGELTVKGDVMHDIWTSHLADIMPDNVELEYGGSPVRKVYEQLGYENERFQAGDHDIASYTVYSDPEDLAKNFPEVNRAKYLGDIYSAGLVDFQPIQRTSTVDVSGTKMRQMIASGDKERFMSFLPDPLSDQAREAIWQQLTV